MTESTGNQSTDDLADSAAAGPPPTEAPLHDEAPDISTGTVAGDPVAGVKVNPDDAAHAVEPDNGPESSGSRNA
jgi:hypothetical protein